MKNRIILTPFFLDEPLAGLEALAEPDWQLNKPRLPDGDKQERMMPIHQRLAEFTAETVASGERPVSICGDCISVIGILAGLQRAGIDPLLIWFDAHGDFNTWETSPSGFLGGMPLAMIVGLGEQTMPQAAGLKTLPENQVILSDARDLDPGEAELVGNSDVTHRHDVNTLLDYHLPDRPLYVHLDTDVIDPRYAPAMNYTAEGGPDPATLRKIFQHLSQSGHICAVSLSSWNPALDKNRQTEKLCMELFYTLIK